MPIYQYQCSECGHSMEALQKMSDPRLTDCPACGKAGLRKQLTAAAFKLKGTGWYETDFKNSGKKPATKSDSNSESKSSAAETGNTSSESPKTSSSSSAGEASAS